MRYRNCFPQLLLVFALILMNAWAQEAPPAPPSADATSKWLAEQEPQWQAAYQREVRDLFEKAVADLKKQYLAALEAQLTAASRDARLDDAVALRAERDRISAIGGLDAIDQGVAPANVKAVRAGFTKAYTGLIVERVTHAKAVYGRYDAILAQSQTALTQHQRFEEALAIRAKREQLRAQWVGPESASDALASSTAPISAVGSAATPAPVATPKPVATPHPGALAISPTLRPAERMDLFMAGSNGITICINHHEAFAGINRDKPSKARVGLREGDVLTVRNADRWDINSFCLSCISSNGQFLFETSEKWTSYVPADEKKWWILERAKEEKPATFAPDKQEYVDLVKKAMKVTPLSHDAQPIRSVLKADGRATYLHYTVTRDDLLPKPDPAPAGK